MATRTISLTPDASAYVDDAIASGRFEDASEMVDEALRLLEEKELIHAAKVERLRAAIQVGEDDISAGRFDVINTDDELRDYMATIRREVEVEFLEREAATAASTQSAKE